MAIRASEVTVLLFVVFCTTCTALDLASILSHRYKNIQNKRGGDGGNPCPTPEKPFPCKGAGLCLPLQYLCDDNIDCEDGFDEDPEVCTAAHRPPVEDVEHFLISEKSWIIPTLFADKSIKKIAHSLAVSQTVDDFRRRLGMKKAEAQSLRQALKAVKNQDEGVLVSFGMPLSAWEEVRFMFNKLLKSGFAK